MVEYTMVNRNKYVQEIVDGHNGKMHRIIQRNPIFDTDNEKYFFELVCDDGEVFIVKYIKKRHNRKTLYSYGEVMKR